MNCELCNTELSAGDISVFPDETEGVTFRVICSACEHVQSFEVFEAGNQIIVVHNRKEV